MYACDVMYVCVYVGGWGDNALASPTGNSSARGVRKEQRSIGYPDANAPTFVVSLSVPTRKYAFIKKMILRFWLLPTQLAIIGSFFARALASLAVFWLEIWLLPTRWQFFGLRFRFCPRVGRVWLEILLLPTRWPFFCLRFGFCPRVGRFFA